jgi:hypothetical protein
MFSRAARSAAVHGTRLATSFAKIAENQIKFNLLNITQPQ